MTVEKALSEADRFVREVSLDTTRTWKLDSQSFDVIGKCVGELGLAINLFGLKRGLAKALKENRLELIPVEEIPKPRVRPGNSADRLYEAQVAPSQFRSITEIRQEEIDKAELIRKSIKATLDRIATGVSAAESLERDNSPMWKIVGARTYRDHAGEDARRRRLEHK